MKNFDLIPEDYKYWHWQRRWLQCTGILLLACFILILSLWAYFHINISRQHARTFDLQRQMAVSDIQKTQMNNLIEREQFLKTHWELLKGLRSGTRVESTLAAVDESLRGEDVWFLSWDFQRLGQKVPRNSITSDSGYHINFTNHLAKSQPEAWKIDTQISINGQAIDHSAFSDFVQRLTQVSEVLAVKISRTSLATINDVDIVEFNIQVLINNTTVEHSG